MLLKQKCCTFGLVLKTISSSSVSSSSSSAIDSRAGQIFSPVDATNQPSGRGLLPSPTAWSPDQHLVAMLADISRFILGFSYVGLQLCFGSLFSFSFLFSFLSLISSVTRLCHEPLSATMSADGHTPNSVNQLTNYNNEL